MLFARQHVVPSDSKACLTAYVDLWKDADVHLPKDAATLPCDKEALKRALASEMDGRPTDVLTFLALMYRRLALFQKLTSADKKALSSAYSYIGVLAAKSGVFGESERAKLSMMLFADDNCNRLMDKVAQEDRKLHDDLVALGHVSKADQEAEWQEIASLTNAQSAKLGMSMMVTAADVSSSQVAQGAR